MSKRSTTTKRIPRINIRTDAYVLVNGRSDFDLYVRGEYVGGFDTLAQATEYADKLIFEQLRRAA